MKNFFTLIGVLFILLFAVLLSSAATVVSGTYTVPGNVAGTQVNNLTDLANLLSVDSVVGNTIFEFTAGYSCANEVYPVVFNYYKGYGGVVIRPAASVSTPLLTTGSPDSVGLVEFNYAYKYKIDGRPGGTGGAQKWTFQNTAVNGSYPVFLLQNSAAYDTLQYLNILASGNFGTGTVYFGSSTTGIGNNNDVLSNCYIGNYAGYPFNSVYAYGTNNAKPNTFIQILNNNIYNFQNMISGPYAGINIAYGGNGGNWTISGNSLYSTINPATLASFIYYGICLNAGSTSFNNVISGNYIGGQQPHCGGAPWGVPSCSGSGLSDMDAINVNSAYTTVSGNTIQNIDMASKHNSAIFRGIVIAGGSARVAYNIIGSDSMPNSIHSGLWGTVFGIDAASTDTTTIDNNIIGNITVDGLYYSADSSVNITTGSTVGVYVGVNNNPPGPAYVVKNNIHGFYRTDHYNDVTYYEMASGGGSATYPITSTGENIIAGIAVESGSGYQYTISKNTIYNLYDSVIGGTSTVYINGIIAPLSPAYINANLVYNLWAPDAYGGSGTYYGVTGIYLPGSGAYAYDVTNNMVRLGYKQDGTPVQNALISGIWDNSGYGPTHKVHCLHNSVYIGGTDNNVAGNNLNSFAMRRDFNYTNASYDSALVRNNIFINNRSNTAGTGTNYGLYLYSNVNLATDYNDVYSNGTNFAYGNIASTDYQTATAFRAQFPGYETHSIASDPLFTSATGVTPNLRLQNSSPVNTVGSSATTLVYDFDSLIRSDYTPVDMGASVVCTAYTLPNATIAATQDTFCAGTRLVFTGSTTNGGAVLNYNFYRNGVSVQSVAGNGYAASNFQTGDSLYVVLTLGGSCMLPDTAKSNVIHLVQTPDTIVPEVNITISPDTGCRTVQFTITATTTNAGSQTSFYFYSGGLLLQASSNGLCRTQSLIPGDSVWVLLNTTGTCLVTNTATSNILHPDVLQLDTASVSIAASPPGVICTGTQVTFMATPVNGGATPTFIWTKNGISVGTNSPTYINTAPHNGDVIKCVLQGSYPCTVYGSNYYATITMQVDSTGAPAVSITANDTGAICTFTPVTFTAHTTNPGNTPVYQWIKNGIATSAIGITYTDATLANGDSIMFRLVTTSACGSPDTVYSNVMHEHILPLVTPSLTIAEVIPGCAPNVTIRATPVNGGTAPLYTWFLNGAGSGYTPDSTLTTNTLVNNEKVYCRLISNAQCAVPTAVISDTITVQVYPVQSSTVAAITCPGTAYLWNGRSYTLPGTYLDTLSTVFGCDSLVTTILQLYPVVTTSLTSTVCYGDTAYFNGRSLTATGTYYDTLSAATGCDSTIIMHFTVRPYIGRNISASLCNGGQYTFNGQTLSTPGTYIDTLAAPTGCDSIITLSLSAGQQINKALTATICEGDPYNFEGQIITTGGVYTNTVTLPGGCDSVTTLTVTANPKPTPVITRGANDTLFCSYSGNTSFQWLLNGVFITGSIRSYYVVHQNGIYSVSVRNANGCTDTSATIDIQDVAVNYVAPDMGIQLYPNPTTGEVNISLSGINGNVTITLADVLGNTLQTISAVNLNGTCSNTLNLSKYAAGIYLIQFNYTGGKQVRRLQVVR